MVRIASVWTSGRSPCRPDTGKHDSGAASSGVFHTGRHRRTGSRLGALRRRLGNQRRIGVGRIHGQAPARNTMRPTVAVVLAMVRGPTAPKADEKSVLIGKAGLGNLRALR